MEIIKTKNICKAFGSLMAVDGIDLSVNQGEIYGIVGPDGAGKSTLMRMLVSIMDPTGGDGWIGGYHTFKDASIVKTKIGYMSQRFGLYGDLTVMENLRFYADIFDVPAAKQPEKIKKLLEFSHLAPFTDRRAENLSGGMKQKLGLAFTLIHQPEILFLDEPTNGVDPVSRRDFWRILYELHREGTTIFLSTSTKPSAVKRSPFSIAERSSSEATPKDRKINGVSCLPHGKNS